MSFWVNSDLTFSCLGKQSWYIYIYIDIYIERERERERKRERDKYIDIDRYIIFVMNILPCKSKSDSLQVPPYTKSTGKYWEPMEIKEKISYEHKKRENL